MVLFIERSHKPQRAANRFADERRILVVILKFQLEVVMKIQHLLQERKVAGVGRWIGGLVPRVNVTKWDFAKYRGSW